MSRRKSTASDSIVSADTSLPSPMRSSRRRRRTEVDAPSDTAATAGGRSQWSAIGTAAAAAELDGDTATGPTTRRKRQRAMPALFTEAAAAISAKAASSQPVEAAAASSLFVPTPPPALPINVDAAMQLVPDSAYPPAAAASSALIAFSGGGPAAVSTFSVPAFTAASAAYEADVWKKWIHHEEAEISTLVHTLPLIKNLEDGQLTIEVRLDRLNDALTAHNAHVINLNETGRSGASLLMMILNFYYKAIPLVPYDKIDRQAEILLELMDSYDINHRDDDGNNLLNFCCDIIPHGTNNNKIWRIAKRALEMGIDKNNKNLHGQTPIIQWARERNPKVIHGVKLLKSNHVDPNIPDKDGNTFLHHVVRNTHSDIFTHLLTTDFYTYGYDFHHRNLDGATFYAVAKEVAEQNPSNAQAQVIHATCEKLLQRWNNVIVPRMKLEIAHPTCTNLLPDLIDLVIQYVDGHGRPFGDEDAEEADETPSASASPAPHALALAAAADADEAAQALPAGLDEPPPQQPMGIVAPNEAI